MSLNYSAIIYNNVPYSILDMIILIFLKINFVFMPYDSILIIPFSLYNKFSSKIISSIYTKISSDNIIAYIIDIPLGYGNIYLEVRIR